MTEQECLGKLQKGKSAEFVFHWYMKVCDVLVAVVCLSPPNLRFCRKRLKVKKHKSFLLNLIIAFYRCLSRERPETFRPQRGFEPWPLRWTPVLHIHRFIIDAHNNLLAVGPTAQLVVHCISIAEVWVRITVRAWKFLYYCDLFNKLTSVFHASVLLLIMNFVITLSK